MHLRQEPVVKAAEEAEKVYEELCEAESELNEKMSISCDCNMKKLLTHGQMSVQNGMIYT